MKSSTCERLLLLSVLVSSVSAVAVAQDASRTEKPVDVRESEMAKRLLNVVAPKLSAGVPQKCSNAMVMLNVTINEAGTVGEEEATSGYPELREPAIAALKQWTYKPFEKHGKPVSVHTHVSIFFLGDGESFPVYSPDGKGGVKGGNMIPLPPGCGTGPTIKRQPDRPTAG